MIKIALTNLGKYNEGELVYEWLDLPYTQEELNDVMDRIGINEEYEEYFISDYEAPFQIEEYESIRKLNKVAESLEGISIPENRYGYDTFEVISFVSKLESKRLINDAFEYIGDIVEEEEINHLIKSRLENGRDWQGIKVFLSGISDISKDFYLIDGYGNLAEITDNRLSNIVSNVLEEVKSNI